MISKGTIRYIKSLQLKKYRNKAQSFLVEGTKSVLELINAGFEVTHIVGTESFRSEYQPYLAKLAIDFEIVSKRQLTAISSLKNNHSVLAVARCLPNDFIEVQDHEYAIALDRIADPGNLGTILRTADWYGIKKVLCSKDTADFYNPKVIQASMGSFTRVRTFYTDLEAYLDGRIVYGAMLTGESLHSIKFDKGGILLVGSESHGISADLIPHITTRVSIPKVGGAESLNAATAMAVICDNIIRQVSS